MSAKNNNLKISIDHFQTNTLKEESSTLFEFQASQESRVIGLGAIHGLYMRVNNKDQIIGLVRF